MVTSWNWLLLTDFASFKPTYLPEVSLSSQLSTWKAIAHIHIHTQSWAELSLTIPDSCRIIPRIFRTSSTHREGERVTSRLSDLLRVRGKTRNRIKAASTSQPARSRKEI